MEVKVTLDLGEHVKHGVSQLLARVRVEDRRDIAKAASVLGLTQSQFIRNVLVQAARSIIAEHESNA